MKKVIRPHRSEIGKIKGSRFIADLYPVTSIDEAMSVLREIRLLRKDASHLCYGIRISPTNYRFSDDGEPRNSAGMPILNRMQSHELIECICTVSRYYGGVKLGIGGLMRAYGSAASKVISESRLQTINPYETLAFSYDYSDSAVVSSVLSAHSDLQPNHQYFEKITTTVAVSIANKDRLIDELNEKTSGRIVFHTKIKTTSFLQT